MKLTSLIVLALLLALPARATEDSVRQGARSPALQWQLDAALAAKGPGYRPRTEHLLADGRPRYTNRLILEDSPYLIQHAHNPVDWYPWGEAAFAKARREHKLIFLSIGYSTCHWCHVMERESFENPEIARLLNDHFVAIKVDRERRPDLDHLYMTAVNLLSGQGGWPMNSLLTPDGQTLHGGTYYPPDDLARLLKNAARVWREHPEESRQRAAAVASAVEQAMRLEAQAAELKPELAATTARQLLREHDELQGGFGPAPKFPNEPLLALLLDQASRGDPKIAPASLAALETDLDAMAAGGIHDQVGGGFHRYSTDNEWLVPHFEKMLYNQAQLARLYLATGRLAGKADYARVARRALDFVLREMTAPEGGFYSALDADSAGGEGRYYLWTPAEVRAVLKPADAEAAIHHYGLSEVGNFEGSNIPHLSTPLDASECAQLDRIDAALLQARLQRPRPHLDDKIVTAWNGLMLTALAEATDVLEEPRYLAAARRAADFLWQHHRQADGGLWRASLAGHAGTPGMLEDYAYFAEGLIALYDASGESRWLTRAVTLADAIQARFLDRERGGYFLAQADAATPMARPRDTSDGALPSGNGVAVQVFADLSRRTGEPRFEAAAQAALVALSGAVQRDPAGHATLLTALERLRLGETGPRQYGGHGAVRATARLMPLDASTAALDLTLQIRPGWHVNAHQPLQDFLIPTALCVASPGWSLVAVDYPPAEVMKLGFQARALALYQGEVHIRARLHRSADASASVPLELHLQTCGERVCLASETLRLEVERP